MTAPAALPPAVSSEPSARHRKEAPNILAEHLDSADAMLLGRKTYEEFAAYWPDQDDSMPLARRTNQIRKYVVSTTVDSFDWTNTQGAGGDLDEAVSAVRRAHDDVMVPGGARLIRTLLGEGLIDEMRFYLDPVVVGVGLRLFSDEGERTSFQLADERGLPNGVRYLAYRPSE